MAFSGNLALETRLNVSSAIVLQELVNNAFLDNRSTVNGNISSFSRNVSLRWPFWQIAFIAGSTMATGFIIMAMIGAVTLTYCRKKKHAQSDKASIYSVPERWDRLSLNYINNPNDLWKSSMDDLADDAYLARLDKEMARRIACMHAYRNPIVNSCETKLDRIG
ncbi:hypothetical protein TTRE_0000186001 [Trichuris trichiura]|uniref:Uncharacterized protein n=1 Tax=Trichuris trichiura TaxID=36087 RepID=A0A077Z4F1_TRITR|nr:hypothetical protein TTRE_0000186001 [Trichuris trichiura]